MKLNNKIIGVDFDGTCVMHKFPLIGEDVPGCVSVLKEIVASGGKIVLWTMRCDAQSVGNEYLTDAINWFIARDIALWGIQENPEQKNWTLSPKAYCHIYIDDAALGCPLINPNNGERPFVDWAMVAYQLGLQETPTEYKKYQGHVKHLRELNHQLLEKNISYVESLNEFINSTYTGCTKEELNSIRIKAEKLLKVER